MTRARISRPRHFTLTISPTTGASPSKTLSVEGNSRSVTTSPVFSRILVIRYFIRTLSMRGLSFAVQGDTRVSASTRPMSGTRIAVFIVKVFRSGNMGKQIRDLLTRAKRSRDDVGARRASERHVPWHIRLAIARKKRPQTEHYASRTQQLRRRITQRCGRELSSPVSTPLLCSRGGAGLRGQPRSGGLLFRTVMRSPI